MPTTFSRYFLLLVLLLLFLTRSLVKFSESAVCVERYDFKIKRFI